MMTGIGLQRMDVLLISRCPPYPLYLGDRLIPYHLARQLSQRGYRIDLLAFYQQPEDLADIPYYERYFRHIQLIPEPARSPASLLSRALLRGRRFPTRRAQSWSPEMWAAIEERLHQRRMDVVHFFGGIHVYEFRDLAAAYPSIIAPYESYTLFLERALARSKTRRERLLTRLRLVMARHYESWMFDGFRRTVVVSGRDAARLRQISPELPVIVIPNGVDLDKFAPTGYEPETPTLIFTGNFDYIPNQDAALRLAREIFPMVRRAVPEAELLLVGNNPPEALRGLRQSGVQVAGSVPDLRPYLEQASLYVCPLRLGAGIKNKVLEAMAMQKAVVATPLSCDGISVTHGRDVILAERNEELARATIRLLRNPELRQQIAANGRRLVEADYTWRGVADAYEKLYAQVIDEHGGARG